MVEKLPGAVESDVVSISSSATSNDFRIQEGGIYILRIRAKKGWYDGQWNTVSVVVLNRPKLLSPTNGISLTKSVDEKLKLSWSSVSGKIKYQIQLAPSGVLNKDGENNSSILFISADGEQAEISNIDDGEYEWKVKAVGPDNTEGKWSMVSKFTVRKRLVDDVKNQNIDTAAAVQVDVSRSGSGKKQCTAGVNNSQFTGVWIIFILGVLIVICSRKNVI